METIEVDKFRGEQRQRGDEREVEPYKGMTRIQREDQREGSGSGGEGGGGVTSPG
jgi:hypothetical protein